MNTCMRVKRHYRYVVSWVALSSLGISFGPQAQLQAQLVPAVPSPPTASMPVDPGEIVVTCSSGLAGGIGSPLDLDAYVVALLDVRNPPASAVAGPTGSVSWNVAKFHNENVNPSDPNIWNGRNLGQVFGLALDNETNPNIYVAASTIYGEFDNPPGSMFGPAGSGAVYRLDGTTGAICPLAMLPNNARVGLGNIAFSSVGNFLYVSNMDDGLIYQVPTDQCPQPQGTTYLTFDHGNDGRAEEGLTPIPDTADRYTPLGRRVWGLAVNESERRLYYAVWWEHQDPQVNMVEDNEVWSVGLDLTGAFIPNSARREFLLPPSSGAPITGFSHPASDLSFTPAGNLMVAERTRTGDSGQQLVGGVQDAHRARVLEFTGAHLSWVGSSPTKFLVGNLGSGQNSAGGVVADCDENVWASGDALFFSGSLVYGFQRIPAGGNMGDAPPTLNSHIVDADGILANGGFEKTEIGDVAINNRCQTCTFEPDNVLCELDATGQVTGTNVVTGTFTNLQDVPGTHLLLPPNATPDGVEVCFGSGQQVLVLDEPVNNGDSFDLGTDLSNSDAVIIKNAAPGDEVCFNMILLGENGVECCHIEVCVIVPPCDCLQVDSRQDEITDIVCNDDGTVDFCYSFQLTNLFGQDVYHAFLAPNGNETFSPDYFDLFAANGNAPLGQGQSVTLKTAISGAQPEDLVSFLITIHVGDFSECCSRDHDVLSPDCMDDGDVGPGGTVLLPGDNSVTQGLLGDINLDEVVDFSDIPSFIELLTAGEYQVEADIDENGVVDFADIPLLVDLLIQQ